MLDVDEIFKKSRSNPELIVDGINFGRGTAVTHPSVKCWRIIDEKLENVEKVNDLYDEETYIVQWDEPDHGKIFFYWKGENATKGYSPLPEEIEMDNPPVERITQWSEPPAFLRLFSGTLMVQKGRHGTIKDFPKLFILRGEIESEAHFYEVPPRKESLRSRTSFILWKSQEVIIWHGNRTSTQSRTIAKKAVDKIFNNLKITQINEGLENEQFLDSVSGDKKDYFLELKMDVMSYTPRLFYLNKITGKLLASEVECEHRSEFCTSFPFLQAHLYTAAQPAIFLLDDDDDVWLWQGWHRDDDENFRSECFSITIDYAKHKSKLTGKLVKVHKVIAGFEPLIFTNLFPTWTKKEDVVELQKREGIVPNTNLLIEVTPEDNNHNANK